jgi:hypothetical protein
VPIKDLLELIELVQAHGKSNLARRNRGGKLKPPDLFAGVPHLIVSLRLADDLNHRRIQTGRVMSIRRDRHQI